MTRKGASRPHKDLEQIYAELPRIACKGLCQESRGPISFSQLEGERIRKQGANSACHYFGC